MSCWLLVMRCVISGLKALIDCQRFALPEIEQQTTDRKASMTHLNNYEGDPSDHIAIIDMTGRFRGAKTLEAFWQNLRDGAKSIKFFTAVELAGTHWIRRY